MDRRPRVLQDERRECSGDQSDTHTGHLNFGITGARSHQHGYDLAGSSLFGRDHGLANPFLFFWREKSFRIDHLTNSPRLHRRRNPRRLR